MARDAQVTLGIELHTYLKKIAEDRGVPIGQVIEEKMEEVYGEDFTDFKNKPGMGFK